MSQEVMSGVGGDDKLWAVTSYVLAPIAPLIVLFLMEDVNKRPYVKLHAVQSVVLWLSSLLLSPLCGVGLLVLFYMLYLAYLCYQGQDATVPGLTDFIKSQGWA